MVWTQDMVGRLVQGWSEGHSASAIGNRLGVSRGAILGKLSRLRKKGVVHLRQSLQRPSRQLRAKRSRRDAVGNITDHQEPLVDTATPLVELQPGQCRWIPKERSGAHPRPFTCDEIKVTGQHYCQDHYDRLYGRRSTK